MISGLCATTKELEVDGKLESLPTGVHGKERVEPIQQHRVDLVGRNKTVQRQPNVG